MNELHRRESDRRIGFLRIPQADQILAWIAIGGILVTLIKFWARGQDLPGRVACLEQKESATDQFKADLTNRLDRIEKKVDKLSR
jgi:hypothetical protein